MRISNAFPSNYIKAADLQGRRITLAIREVKLEDVSGDGEHKPVIYFERAQKGLVLNKTNAMAIAAAYGDETDHWIGRKIELFEMMVSFQGRATPGIRVFVPRADVAAPDLEAPLADTTLPVTGRNVYAEVKNGSAPLPARDLNDGIPF